MIHPIEEFKSSITLMTSGSQLNVCTVAFDDPLLANHLNIPATLVWPCLASGVTPWTIPGKGDRNLWLVYMGGKPSCVFSTFCKGVHIPTIVISQIFANTKKRSSKNPLFSMGFLTKPFLKGNSTTLWVSTQAPAAPVAATYRFHNSNSASNGKWSEGCSWGLGGLLGVKLVKLKLLSLPKCGILKKETIPPVWDNKSCRLECLLQNCFQSG